MNFRYTTKISYLTKRRTSAPETWRRSIIIINNNNYNLNYWNEISYQIKSYMIPVEIYLMCIINNSNN
jgi:hypothetical protein